MCLSEGYDLVVFLFFAGAYKTCSQSNNEETDKSSLAVSLQLKCNVYQWMIELSGYLLRAKRGQSLYKITEGIWGDL